MQTDAPPAASAYRRPLFPLMGHGITGPVGPLFRPTTARQWLARPLCLVVGCEYRTTEFRSWCLYACARCSCEMFGRTFDDIEPAPSDDDNWWHDE